MGVFQNGRESPPPCPSPTMGEGTTTVSIARTWIGTPYHHQASIRGVGADCIGLVRGVYRELAGREAEGLPAYTRDWA